MYTQGAEDATPTLRLVSSPTLPDTADKDEKEVFGPRKVLKQQSSERTDVSHLLKVNMCYAMSYFMMYGLGVWYTAFVLGGNGQTTQIFEAKFGWTEDETVLYNTIISSSGLVGMTIGSFTGGPLI